MCAAGINIPCAKIRQGEEPIFDVSCHNSHKSFSVTPLATPTVQTKGVASLSVILADADCQHWDKDEALRKWLENAVKMAQK